MAIDKLLKPHFGAVILVLLATAAFFDAQGIMQVASATLAPNEKQIAMAPLLAGVAPAPRSENPHATSAEAILSRNPFDSVTGPLNLPPPEESADVPPAEPDLGDPYSAPDCEGVTAFIITASADPDWSLAAFETKEEKGKRFLRRRGGDVGGRMVKYIAWDRAWLTSGRRLCQARMFKQPDAGAPAAAQLPPPPPVPGGVSDDIKKGIQRVGASEFNVDRGVVDKILENQAELMRVTRIVPDTVNGKVVGIRLSGVRPDTLLGALGMENDDRLEKINGFDMTSPEKALEAYARLRTSDHLTISVNRRGQGMNIDYNIK